MINAASPDVDLVLASQRGDEEAWRFLYERHDPKVDKIIKSLLWAKNCFDPTDHGAEAKGNCWKKGFINISELREPAKFPSWIGTIATNTAFEHLRAQCIQQQNDFVPMDDAPVIRADVIPLPILIEGAIMAKALYELADEISPRFGKILRMRVEEYSFHEIASRMGETYVNVRNIFYRNLSRFNEEREKRGL
jgi:DNA-directed RNA polymerase specialized sigma24 family protein